MWATPLLAPLSGPIIIALEPWLSTYQEPPSLVNVRSPDEVFATMPSVRSPLITLPATTCSIRILVSCALSARIASSVAESILANASSFGAKTVNGPTLLSVSTRSALMTAVTRVESDGTDCASPTIVSCGAAVLAAVVASGAGRWTVSMTWATPLLAGTSAWIIFALEPGLVTYQEPPSLVNVRSPDTMPSVRSVLITLAITTCSSRIFFSCAVSAMMAFRFGILANAALFGAKTVNGPAPERVAARPAALTAATRVESVDTDDATSTMFSCGAAVLAAVVASEAGRRTVSITWATPLLAGTSAWIIFALEPGLVTYQEPPSLVNVRSPDTMPSVRSVLITLAITTCSSRIFFSCAVSAMMALSAADPILLNAAFVGANTVN